MFSAPSSMTRSRSLQLVVLSVPAVLCGQSCPPPCQCSWVGGKVTLECSSRGLETVPILENDARKTRNVVDGKFANNNNLTLDDELAIFGYRGFRTLDFKSCNIEEILKHIFKGLANLKSLDLSSNH